ncbi:MAG: hypothetical protein APF80_06880 [Alphaproteobacteria bacterium BRH_c36]|nr:MAG: hypothetical protein APF80_06880 [Alphaproteobacteria bacterium BRH_c36]
MLEHVQQTCTRCLAEDELHSSVSNMRENKELERGCESMKVNALYESATVGQSYMKTVSFDKKARCLP